MIRRGTLGKISKNFSLLRGRINAVNCSVFSHDVIRNFSTDRSNFGGHKTFSRIEVPMNNRRPPLPSYGHESAELKGRSERSRLTDAYLQSLSVKDLQDLRNLYLNNSHTTIKAMVKSVRYDMKNERQGDVDLSEDTNEQPSRRKPLRHPVGVLRNNRVQSDPGDMELTFLGTVSACPTLSRGVSCTALRFKTEMYLFDCGEASQLQFMYSSVSTRKINKIFITHMHGDHVFGIPAMLCGLGSLYRERLRDGELTQEDLDGYVIDIYGPEGIRSYIRNTLQLTLTRTTVPYRIHELKDVPMVSPHYRAGDATNDSKNSTSRGPGSTKESVVSVEKPHNPEVRGKMPFGEQEGSTDIYPDTKGFYHLLEDGEKTIKAAPLAHSAPCVGYVMEEKSRVGTLRFDKLQPYLVANKEGLYEKYGKSYLRVNATIKNLKPDESFTFPNGDVVYGRDVVEPPIEGRKIVILGDTCNSERIVPLAMNADVLVHESTCVPEYGCTMSPGEQTADAIKKRHSTPRMAGQFANKINAKQLLLTHFSRRLSGHHEEVNMKPMWRLEDLARRAAPKLVGDNDIIAAWDFMMITIHPKNHGRQFIEKAK